MVFVHTVCFGGTAYTHLPATGRVQALLALPDGGIAATSEGVVDLFNVSAVQRGGTAYAQLAMGWRTEEVNR